MRRWCILVLSLILVGAAIWLVGCEGEEGVQGPKGVSGPTGPDGTDITAQAPSARWVSFALTNGTNNAVSAARQVYITFDSTVEASRDTIVGNYLSEPPLIDGMDGEEPEWGVNFSKLRFDFYNIEGDPTAEDPNIYEVVCRTAYDEEFIYMALVWKEIAISVKDSQGQDSSLVLASLSNELNELKLNGAGPDTLYNVSEEKWDTTFAYLRTDSTMKLDTIICFPPPVGCLVETTFVLDSTFVWQPTGMGQDQMVIIWTEQNEPTWTDAVFDLVFRTDGFTPALTGDMFADVWHWGAATSGPALIADDCLLTSGGLEPDVGHSPFIFNYSEQDSVPIYMNRRDPNLRTATNPGEQIYPLWYYDAVGFAWSGWALNRAAFAPGVVNMVPSGSRADVFAVGVFDSDVWTLEIKRARKSHSGDDMIF